MGRKYKNPPVVEALCEFEFIPNQPWDLTIPGLIYEKVKNEGFPIKRQQLGIGVQLKASETGLEHKIEPAPPRDQFFREDKTDLIQVAPNILVVNQLKPYPSWHKLKPLILNAFDIYKEVANPKALKGMGLRYINIFNFDKEPIKLEEYFNYYPFVPKELPQTQDSFLTRVEFPYEDGKERLILALATVIPPKPNILSIVLDLVYMMSVPESVPMDAVSDWLEKAHQRIEDAFEICITDKARINFEKEKV